MVCGLFSILVAVAGLTACGGSTPSSTASNERGVGRADYGNDWPLTVDSGTLRCEAPGAVTFTSDGTTYWVNGTAGNQAETRGWADIHAIWADDPSDPGLKIYIGTLIDDGLALCD
jgi:hypothetical protein